MKKSLHLTTAKKSLTVFTALLLLFSLSFNVSWGQLSINGFTLTTGAVSGAGTLSGSATSNLITNATTTVNFASGANVLKNLTVNAGTLTLGNPLNITAGQSLNASGIITVATSATLASAGNLTLQSNQYGSASVATAAITGNYITGDVTVERYIPANSFRSWRLLSVPTYGNGQTIRQAWQEGDANSNPLQNNLPGFGTQITSVGNLATAQYAGFDNVSVRSSLLKYNGTEWIPATATNSPIATKKGYFLYIRGERLQGITGTLDSTSATTLRTKGSLYQGTQTTEIIPANSYGAVGNIYASAVDFTKLILNGGVDSIYYIWDSKKRSGNSLGVYQTFSKTNNYAALISGGSFAAGEPNVAIQSGQAFFVQTATDEGSVTFTEDSKIISNDTAGFRPATPTNTMVKMDSRLYSTTASNSSLADANVVVFNNAYSNTVDGNDATKLANTGENFGILRSNKILAVEGRQAIVNTDTILFNLSNLQQQSYKLEFAAQNLGNTGLIAVLEDNYLHSSTALDLNASIDIDFKVNADAVSKAANRFRIVFTQAAPLPVSFISIAANRTGANVKVDWKVAVENGIRSYEAERSSNGRSFATAGSVTAAATSSYNWTDVNAGNGTLFYRIKSISTSGEVKYSAIVKLAAGLTKPGYNIAPNPVEGNTVNIHFSNQPAGNYLVKLSNILGQSLQTNSLTHTGGNSLQVLNFVKRLVAGIYQLEIIAPDKSRQTQSLIVKTKD